MEEIHDPLSKRREITTSISELCEILEQALQNPQSVPEYVKTFQSKTFEIYIHPEEAVGWINKQESRELLTDSSLSAFKVSSMLLVDRYLELNSLILRGVCQLFVVGGRLGKCAMGIVSEAANGGNKAEVISIILEVVTPLLDLMETSSAELQYNLLTSLSQLPSFPEVSVCLQPIIYNVVSDIKNDPWNSEYLELFKIISLDEDNAEDISHYGVSKHLMTELDKYQEINDLIALGEEIDDRICELLSVISVCLSGCEIKFISTFSDNVLIPNIKHLIGDRQGTHRLTLKKSLLAGGFIDLSTAVCKNSSLSLDELCFGFHLFDLLVVPVKEALANPLVLTPSLEGLSYILRSPVTSNKYVSVFIEEVDSTSLLSYFEDSTRENLLRQWTPDVVNDLFYTVNKFIVTLFEISHKNSSMLEYIEKMLEKGMNTNVLSAFYYTSSEPRIRRELIKIISLFPENWIDSTAIRTILDLLSKFTVSDFIVEELEAMVVVLQKRLELVPFEILVERISNLLVMTLKSTNSGHFELLQYRCVELLLDVSDTETGRSLLRTEAISSILRKSLKYEQDFSHFTCKDLKVELCWVGSSAQFLYSCMFDMYHLKHDRRQFFRVIRALERCINGSDASNNEKLLFLEEMCNKELDDFYEVDGSNEVTFCDPTGPTSESLINLEGFRRINRDHQHQMFITLELIDKIPSFLSPSFSPFFVRFYQEEKFCNENSEYWAGVLKAEKLDCEKLTIVPKFDFKLNYSSVFDDDPSVVGTEIESSLSTTITKSTYKLASFAISKNITSTALKGFERSYFQILPKFLLNKIWMNECTKQINPAYAASSYLRILYGLLYDNTSSLVRKVVKEKFRDPEFVRTLIKLSTCSSIMDVNIGGKLIKLCTRALEFERNTYAESMDMIIVYDIISGFSFKMCNVIREAICSVHINWMDIDMKHVQYLVLQLFKFYSLLYRQVSMVKFSNVLEIQEHFSESCLNRFIPESVLSLVLIVLSQIITFERSSHHGTYIAHLFDTSIIELIRDNCLKIIVGAGSSCPNTNSYFAINAICKHRRHDQLSLRHSLVDSLLKQMQLSAIGKLFQAFLSRKKIERVLYFDKVWVVSDDIKNVDECFIAITTRRIYFLSLDDDEFITLLKFSLKSSFHTIDQGMLYFLEEDGKKALFSLSYSSYDDIRHLANGGNHSLIIDGASKLLRDDNFFASLCKNEDSISLAVRTSDAIHIFTLDAKLLICTLYHGEQNDEKIVLKSFIQPKVGEQTNAVLNVQYLTKTMQQPIDGISEIVFNKDPSITLHFSNEQDDKDSEVCVLEFINDSLRERFKKNLAQAIANQPWQRTWEVEDE